MNGSFLGDGFARGSGDGAGAGQGWPMSQLWNSMEQLGKQFEQRVGGTTRMGRGDVRASVLVLLTEQSMHGYQIIREIEERSGGSWKPSPGSVYPTLQLLTDEGLIRAEESAGRKTYSLTDEGRIVAAAEAERTAPWLTASARNTSHGGPLTKAGVDLAQAVAQVGRSGKPEQVTQAVDVLDDARRKIFSILAQS